MVLVAKSFRWNTFMLLGLRSLMLITLYKAITQHMWIINQSDHNIILLSPLSSLASIPRVHYTSCLHLDPNLQVYYIQVEPHWSQLAGPLIISSLGLGVNNSYLSVEHWGRLCGHRCNTEVPSMGRRAGPPLPTSIYKVQHLHSIVLPFRWINPMSPFLFVYVDLLHAA